jgi:hypothetical protein
MHEDSFDRFGEQARRLGKLIWKWAKKPNWALLLQLANTLMELIHML